MLLEGRAAGCTYYWKDMLLDGRAVGWMCCWMDVLLDGRAVGWTCCWMDVLLVWEVYPKRAWPGLLIGCGKAVYILVSVSLCLKRGSVPGPGLSGLGGLGPLGAGDCGEGTLERVRWV